MIQPVDVLDRATQLITEKGWCKDYYAQDADGKPISAFSDNAEAYCVVGAIQRSCQELGDHLCDTLWGTLDLLTPYMHPGQITIWNDEAASEREIISVLRSALSAARQTAVVA